MPAPTIGTREQWLEQRKQLLEREKELTRRSDELARLRRELPWVPVEKEYVFESNDGPKTLAELFDGRSQLIVYHFMHGPRTPDGCKGCTFATDSFDGSIAHLNGHDVAFVCSSRSPLQALNDYKRRMGWSVPWVSSGDSDFDHDFSAFSEEDRRAGVYNFVATRSQAAGVLDDNELMALSVFALHDGVVYHTYTCFDRGTDVLNVTWQLLDRTPSGRDEGAIEGWPHRGDEYATAAAAG